MPFAKSITCPACHGSKGHDTFCMGEWQDCETCNGMGYIHELPPGAEMRVNFHQVLVNDTGETIFTNTWGAWKASGEPSGATIREEFVKGWPPTNLPG